MPPLDFDCTLLQRTTDQRLRTAGTSLSENESRYDGVLFSMGYSIFSDTSAVLFYECVPQMQEMVYAPIQMEGMMLTTPFISIISCWLNTFGTCLQTQETRTQVIPRVIPILDLEMFGVGKGPCKLGMEIGTRCHFHTDRVSRTSGDGSSMSSVQP